MGKPAMNTKTKAVRTPGPWQIEGDPSDGRISTPYIDDEITVRTGAQSTAADTRLIAASPRLLEACKAVCSFSGFVGGNAARPAWWTDDVSWREWVNAHQKVQAAIREAEDGRNNVPGPGRPRSIKPAAENTGRQPPGSREVRSFRHD